MKPISWRTWLLLPLASGAAGTLSADIGHPHEVLVDFSDLTLEPESGFTGGPEVDGFESEGFFFNTDFTDWGGGATSWGGWAYSNQTDTTTPGFGNELSAIAGGGAAADGSAETGEIYAVAYGSSRGDSVIYLPEQHTGTPRSVMVTNTTYAYLSMLEGDDFAKQFGGAEGTDPDFFTLTIYGLDHAGAITGEVDVALADFTAPGASDEDFILDEWTAVDLGPLGGGVTALTFSLASSDRGSFGSNTPTYFALDRLEVDLAAQIIADAQTLTDDWKHAWIGFYADADAPWVYHYALGWLYWSGADDGVWFYSQEAGAWFWTSRGYFPSIWRHAESDWVYFYTRSDPGALHYYRFSDGSWVSNAESL